MLDMVDIFVSGKTNLKKKKKEQKVGTRGKAKHKIYKNTHNPIAAFNYYPDHVKFIAADSKERIILVLRRHPITNIRWGVVALFMLLAPFFLSFVEPVAALPTNFQLIAFLIWYMITLAFIIEEFLGWYFNVNIITDERIFDVDFVNLIYREITDANIDQIQDVTVQVGGVLRTMFNYGDVVIQTASEVPRIEFLAVPRPDDIARIIRELRIEEEQEKLEGRAR